MASEIDLLSDEYISGGGDDIDSAIEGGSSPWYKVGSSKPVIVTEKESYAAKLLPEKVNACSLISKGAYDSSNMDAVCSSDKFIAAVGGIIGESLSSSGELDSNTRRDIMEKAKEKTGCKDEVCVIKSDIAARAVGKDGANAEIRENMKIKGPTDTSLLNNFNIDQTLTQWQSKFKDFYAYNFNMRDFEQKGDTLARVDLADLYARGFRTAACVINSDYYRGAGKHWMALFVDMRGENGGSNGRWSVEFFNSSGNPPYAEFAAWLEKSRVQLESITASGGTHPLIEIILCCDLPHQKTKTECGLYSLYYIWARLNGIPPEFFKKYIISDVLMIALRQHLYTGTTNKSGVVGEGGSGPIGINPSGEFDIEIYKTKAKIPWENDVDKATINKSTTGGDEISFIGDCKIGMPIEEVTQRLIKSGKLDKMFIYGNLTTQAEVDKKKSTSGGSDNFSLILDHTHTHTLPYRRRTKEPKLSLYWEQRNVLLSIINAMTECKDILHTDDASASAPNDVVRFSAIVLYAGAAPGTHVPYLAKLFPGVKFILYGGDVEFSIAPTDQIEIHPELFTDAVAAKYKRGGGEIDSSSVPVIFIADIKSTPASQSIKDVENAMQDDIEAMQRWQYVNQYDAALLKFCLPYCKPGKTKLVEHLDGKLYYGVFMPQTSTESRLLVRGSDNGKMKEYDAGLYESEHFFHNTIRRIWGYFDHNVIGEGIDHCYDCRAEIEILKNYIMMTLPQLAPEDLNRKISIMSREISQYISPTPADGSDAVAVSEGIRTLIQPPHGVCKNIKMEEKFGHLIAKYGDIIAGRGVNTS